MKSDAIISYQFVLNKLKILFLMLNENGESVCMIENWTKQQLNEI